MIRATDIQEGFLHLVGWEQNYDTTDIVISENLTESESGIYFQQIHPLLTLENLNCIAPNFKNITYPEYDAETEYSKGQVIMHNAKLYKSLEKSLGEEPSGNSDYWIETNPFSEWLEKKTKASIYKALMRYYNDKIVKGTSKSLVESKTLFDGTGRIYDVIPNRHNLVGFEIIPIRSKGVTLKINKIGLQFSEPGEYTIYIMHSSCFEPIKVIKLEKVKANSMEWFKLDEVYLPYESLNTDAGGSWYICYLQSELPENSAAINKDKDWSKGPCSGCSRREFIAWQAWSKFIEVHPFNIKEVDAEIDAENMHLWDIENNDYDYTKNYGINLDITIECDITDYLIEQRHQFVDVISKQLAIDMLREFAYNPNVRTNRHSINAARTEILYEIDGDSSSMKKSGLSYQLEQSFKSIEVTFTGIDRVCQPCKNNGMRYRTV